MSYLYFGCYVDGPMKIEIKIESKNIRHTYKFIAHTLNAQFISDKTCRIGKSSTNVPQFDNVRVQRKGACNFSSGLPFTN